MKVRSIKSLWGMTGSLEEQVRKIAESGYQGIEAPLPSKKDAALFKELLHSYELDYVAQIFAETKESFQAQAAACVEYAPLLVNAQSGRDDMDEREQFDFFTEAVRVEKGLGLIVGHETHRSRPLFTPWTTEKLLNTIEDLKITADFSHWVCVTESLLERYGKAVQTACERTIHVHSRVGYAQGPQVPDPRDSHYQKELHSHLGWWKRVAEERKKEGHRFTTFTPEYGPSPYMQTLPYTQAPAADLWDVCLWMKSFVEKELG